MARGARGKENPVNPPLAALLVLGRQQNDKRVGFSKGLKGFGKGLARVSHGINMQMIKQK
jgi:hypothetical protein